MRKIIAGSLICVFLLAGCNSSAALALETTATPTPFSNIILQAAAKASSTPTPFQPIPPTLTPTLTFTPTMTSTSTPVPTPTIPSSVNLGLPRPNGQVNILILGSDYRTSQGYRTDLIMVLSLNPTAGTASLVSFPRDLYVNIPGMGLNRINAAMPNGGFSLLASTMKTNFDVTTDYYIMTNFNGFKNIVDTLGGITVNASKSLTDKCDLPQAINKYCTISTGNNLMDGATALWYVRSRYSTSDFDRTRRAQEVMLALFQKVMSLNGLNRGSELFTLFKGSVETNLTVDTVLQLLPFSTTILANPSLVKQYAIGASNVSNYVVPSSGAEVLLPNWISISPIIKQAFYP